MANKRAKPEEIVTKLRQVEVLVGQGMPRADAIRQISVTEQTYYLIELTRYQLHLTWTDLACSARQVMLGHLRHLFCDAS